MSEQQPTGQISDPRDLNERVGLLRELYERSIMTWSLLWDRRVGFWPKLIPLLGVIYVISPVDLLPAWLMGAFAPLGTLDDLGVVLLILNLFVGASPPDVVSEYRRDLRRRHPIADDDVIDGEVIDGHVEELNG